MDMSQFYCFLRQRVLARETQTTHLSTFMMFLYINYTSSCYSHFYINLEVAF